MARKDDLEREKEVVAKLYKSACEACEKKYKPRKRFTFHHLFYKKTEKSYKDFDNPLDYQAYILPIIRKRPNGFALLCAPCHKLIERLKIYKKDNFRRIIALAKKSRYKD